MSKTHYIARPCFSLKAAYTALIEAAGGALVAADYVRVSSSQLHRYTDPAAGDCHMPADIVLILERLTGQPLVTLFTAQNTGYELRALDPDAATSLAEMTASLGHEMADLSGAVLDALRDGHISPDEALRIAAEASDVQRQASDIITRAATLSGAGDPPDTRKKNTSLKAV